MEVKINIYIHQKKIGKTHSIQKEEKQRNTAHYSKKVDACEDICMTTYM